MDPGMKKNLLALGLLAAIAAPTHAATTAQPDRLDALEARIKQLEANAEAMRQQALAATQALEMARAEIESMKATQEATQQQLAASEANQPAPAADAAGANGNAFNPAISIVLNGSVTQHSLDPDTYVRAGFPLVGEGGPLSIPPNSTVAIAPDGTVSVVPQDGAATGVNIMFLRVIRPKGGTSMPRSIGSSI